MFTVNNTVTHEILRETKDHGVELKDFEEIFNALVELDESGDIAQITWESVHWSAMGGLAGIERYVGRWEGNENASVDRAKDILSRALSN